MRSAAGQKDARACGGFAAAWLVFLSSLYLFSDRKTFLSVGFAVELLIAISAAWCASVLLRRSSVIASGWVLLLVLIELYGRVVLTESTVVADLGLALLLALQALRGSLVNRKRA